MAGFVTNSTETVSRKTIFIEAKQEIVKLICNTNILSFHLRLVVAWVAIYVVVFDVALTALPYTFQEAVNIFSLFPALSIIFGIFGA